jgi:hypothetical protein
MSPPLKKDGTLDKRSLATSMLDDPTVQGIVVGAVSAGATLRIAASIAYAQGFSVTEEMIAQKKVSDPQFKETLDTCALKSDSMVAVSLYRKATVGEDTTAMIFWLKNRQPKFWRDRRELEVLVPDITGTLRSAADAARERKRLMLEAMQKDAITVSVVPQLPDGNGNGHKPG